MILEDKLQVHIESIIFQDLPEGTHLNAAQVLELTSKATPEQRRRAAERALVRNPLLDECEVSWLRHAGIL